MHSLNWVHFLMPGLVSTVLAMYMLWKKRLLLTMVFIYDIIIKN